MRKVCPGFLMLLMAAFAASAAPAPVRDAPPLGGLLGGAVSLLTRPNVREELKLSEDQGKKIDKLFAEYKEALGGLSLKERMEKSRELRKAKEEALAKILSRTQFKRAEQIRLQELGMIAFSASQVVAALKLTEEQQARMKVIRIEALKKRVALRREGAPQEEVVEENKKEKEKLLNVLTAQQKAKWKELTGEPFKLELRRPE